MDKPYERQVHASQAAFMAACDKQQDKGDLRGTRQGDHYPLVATMYQCGEHTAWFLEDLQKGLVLCVAGRPLACCDEFTALSMMNSSGGQWREGRPIFNAFKKHWVLQSPSNPVRVVRLHSMLHPNTSQA